MNIDLDAIRALLQDRELLCEDIASQAQSEQLRLAKAESRLGRMNRARVNEITLTRLQREAELSAARTDQFRRLFTNLACKRE